jgi:hypothetical protein
MQIIVTVDTEPDNEWSEGPSLRCDNLRHVPRFQELCDRFRFPVSYLITYDVARDPVGIELLRDYLARGVCEVGAHLHPWSTPPGSTAGKTGDRYSRPFPCEYPEAVLREMCANLTEAIERAFEVRPTSYRAGRFGFDEVGARLLLELGYTVDCSVTPGVSWARHVGRPGGNGGPSFLEAPAYPYFISPDRITRPGDGKLLELPVTILYLRWPFVRQGRATEIWTRAAEGRLLGKVARRLGYARKWFRPYPNSRGKDLIEVYRAAKRAELPVLQMMLHSSELMPGASPYRPDQESIERLYEDLEEVFVAVSSDGVTGTTLAGFAGEMCGSFPRG